MARRAGWDSALKKAADLCGEKKYQVQNIKNQEQTAGNEPNHTATLTKIFTTFKNGLNSGSAKKPKQYLQSRGLLRLLSEAEAQIGYNSAQFHHRGKLNQADQQACIQAGLLIPSKRKNPNTNGTVYTPFAKDCIIFPLKNTQNQTVSFYGRSIRTDAIHGVSMRGVSMRGDSMTTVEIRNLVTIHSDPYTAMQSAHAIAILTEWDEFKTYDWQKVYDQMLKPAFVFDGRNIVDKKQLTAIGFELYNIGKGE